MDALQLLWIPFALSLVLTAIHTYLGLHVLARKIVFVDLALAQTAALGATVAFMLGHAPQTLATYGYSLLFTLSGAILLSFSRNWSAGGRISQETIVGVIYVVAAAAAILLIDQAPQGAEHLKQLLTGSILTVTLADLAKLSALYAFLGAVHWLLRRPLLRVSFDHSADRSARTWWWDFVFYALFGIVVTSSVAVAGVLLVFSFLIIPAMIGTLYSRSVRGALVIGGIAGAMASAIGLGASYRWDLPTGAAMVCAFGLTLAIAALVTPFQKQRYGGRPATLDRLMRPPAIGLLSVFFLSALWLSVNPRADQPLLDVAEAIVPRLRVAFLTPNEESQMAQSRQAEISAFNEARRLTAKERSSRWQGEALSDEDVTKIASFTQSFLEMKKGEQTVQREIRNKARERQRWVLGVPGLLLSAAAALFLLRVKPESGGRESAPAGGQTIGQ